MSKKEVTQPAAAPKPPRNPFSGYQVQRVESRGLKLDEELKRLAKSKAEFPNITELARDLASKLSNEADGPCSASTLLRNGAYKAKLLSHISAQPGMKAKLPVAQSFDSMAQSLEIGNLRSEVSRLKAFIASQSTFAPINEDVRDLQQKNNELRAELNKIEQDLSQASSALSAILANTKGLIERDELTGNIVDRSRKINNILYRALNT